jgi:hypothetical protein
VFVANGYGRQEVKIAMRRKEKERDSQEDMIQGTFKMTYVKGLSERLRKVFNSVKVRAAIRCGVRIRDAGNKTIRNMRQI